MGLWAGVAAVQEGQEDTIFVDEAVWHEAEVHANPTIIQGVGALCLHEGR